MLRLAFKPAINSHLPELKCALVVVAVYKIVEQLLAAS